MQPGAKPAIILLKKKNHYGIQPDQSKGLVLVILFKTAG
jgi:hypothetical protein